MSHDHPANRPTRVRAAVAAILGTSALTGFGVTAHAQDAEPALEEITVTGSRIVRKDFEATSPIVTVSSEVFENTGTGALEANLNKLPQFVPAVSQFVTQDVQNTATNTVGASTVSLRGLGPNRNLVLIDGRRAMPVNASMATDINSIPSAAIERVEITTGGASSVYGADAVGGVVNFVLKKNFEGFQFDAQYGSTEQWDGDELRLSALMGTNFSDGRGNVMFGVEHFNRDEARQIDRDFYRELAANPTVNGSEFWWSASAYVPTFGNLPNQSVIDSIFDQAAPGAIGANSQFFVNTDGTIYTGGASVAGPGVAAGAYRYNGPLDGWRRKRLADGSLGQNATENLISIPLERWSMFGRAQYDFNDSVSAFAEATFNTNSTESVLQYSPASNGWAALIPYGNGIYAPSVDSNGNTLPDYQAGGRYGLNCPATGGCTNSQAFPVPAELAALLDSRPDPNAPWQLNRVLDFLPPRGSANESTMFQITAGLNGRLPIQDWTWEAYASHGETDVRSDLVGFASLERYRAVVTSPNFGRNFFQTGNGAFPGNNFAGATGRCSTGLPIFGDFPVSDDCVASITANLQNNTKMEQDIVEANVQGLLADLPTGELRFALGTTYRENFFRYRTDGLTGQESFLDGGIGLFPAGNSQGRTSVKEVYGELLVPVVRDLPGFKRVNLELGYRYSDYNSVGSVNTYKGMLDWVISDFVRFRGGHQLAIRAPNIGELYLARTQAVGSTSFGDFCSRLSTAPSGANPATNINGAAGAAHAEAICRQLMGPTGAAAYYAQPQAPGGFNIALSNTVGNPDLDPEEAKTYTAGFVFRSPFETPALSKLTAAVDWYSIKLTDAIAPISVDTVVDQCLSMSANPTGDINTPACQAIVRDPNTGAPGTIDVSYSNQGIIKTSGVDLQLDWRTALADIGLAAIPGDFSVNFLLNWVDSFKTQANPNAPTFEWVGSLGPNTPGLNTGIYEWKTFTTFSYLSGPVTASLRWRHLPSVDSQSSVLSPLSTTLGVGSYDLFDLSGTWQVNPSVGLRLGIDNLLDKDPPLANVDPARVQSGGTYLSNLYDVLGRRYYMGVRVQF